MQSLNAFDLFKEELDIDDIASKVNTIHKVTIVATLMSSEAIKNSLIPFLDSKYRLIVDLIKKQDDEVVFAITQQFANLAPMLGVQHTLILPYLENLCAHDQTVVRQRAVSSISKLLNNYSDNEINNFIIPLIIRLSSNEVNFTCRVSAALLMSNVYPRAGPNKQKIRQKFIDISNEQMLMLQRVTATKISQMCQVYEKEYVVSDLISILKHRSTDQQDQIRVLAVQSFKSVSKILTRDQNKTYIIPLIIQAAEDKSWRVRLCLSKNFTQIAENFGKEVTDMSLIQTYGNLLKDTEVDVKIEAVKALSGFIKIVSVDKISVLIPQVLQLGKDSLAVVRCILLSIQAHVGGVLSNMIGCVSKDQAYQNIQPLIKDLMKDDSQQVRKGGIIATAKFIEVMGPQSFNPFYPSIKSCAQDSKWRVRLELLKSFTALSIKLQNVDIFTKHLEPIYLSYLKDRAAAIRKMGVEKISELYKSYSNGWIHNFANRVTQSFQKQTNYQFKITAVYSMKQVCLLVSDNLQKYVTFIFKASQDQVPNVREVCVKSLRDIGLKWMNNPVKDLIKKHLSALVDDQDKEVRQRATEALSKL